MKAKLVREFLNEAAPIKPSGEEIPVSNYEESKEPKSKGKDNTKTKTWQLLKWLGEQPDGATLTEIQHYIFVNINGNPEDEFWEKSTSWTTPRRNNRTGRYSETAELRKTRGYWNTQLFGTDFNHGGILHNFCEKVGKKWVLKRMPDKSELLYDPNTASRHYPWSQRRAANDDRIAQSKASFR